MTSNAEQQLPDSDSDSDSDAQCRRPASTLAVAAAATARVVGVDADVAGGGWGEWGGRCSQSVMIHRDHCYKGAVSDFGGF